MNDSVDHRALIASMSDGERRSLQTRSDSAGLKRLAAHCGLLVATGAWIAAGWLAWPLALMLHGILLVFLFTAQHEATHETAFDNTQLNLWVARLCGFTLIVPPLWFRYFHFAHHRHTQDPDKDPELEGGKPQTAWEYAKHVSGLPLWVSMVKILVGNAFGAPLGQYVPAKAHARVRREARVLLLAYAALLGLSFLTGSTLLLWVWVVPALLGQPFLRLYLLAEHGHCPMVANMLENTRTTHTNALVRFIAWNMPFHAEHHAMPTVPFHQLPRLHEHSKDHLKSVSDGYRAFHSDYVAALTPTAKTETVSE